MKKFKLNCGVDALVVDFNIPEAAANVLVKKNALVKEIVNNGSHAICLFLLGYGQTCEVLLPVGVLDEVK